MTRRATKSAPRTSKDCGHDAHCAACGVGVEFDPKPVKDWDEKKLGPCPVQPKNLAIRCAYCFRVFCVGCSTKHFAIENEERMVDKVARKVVSEVRSGKVRGPGRLSKR